MKEDLFRFLVIRPADERSGVAADLATASKLQADLTEANGDPREIDAAIASFVRGKSFLEHPANDSVGMRLFRVDEQLSKSEDREPERVVPVLRDEFRNPDSEIGKKGWANFRVRLSDSLVAHAFAKVPPPGDARLKTRVRRLVLLLEKLAESDSLPAEEVTEILGAPMLLPPIPLRRAPAPRPAPPPAPTPAPASKAPQIVGAIEELSRVPVSSFADLAQPSRAARRVEGIQVLEPNAAEVLKLTTQAARALSADTSKTLREMGLDPATTPVPRMLEQLRYQHTNEQFRLFTGTTLLFGGIVGGIVFGGTTTLPSTIGEIRRLGVGELMLVRQRLLRYESVEVAHIENVLGGETKIRDHKRRRMTDEFTSEEKERTSSEEQEFSSTGRFELSTEVSETMREEFEVRGGLRVQASYGPSIEIEAEVEAGYEMSSERAERTATKLSREIVQKSVAKVEEKVRSQKSLRIVEEVEERNNHTLANTDATPRRGVYQWVEKIYEAQTYNYGTREMYEFDVPEPGAYLLRALKETVQQRTGLKEPPAFTIRPDDISEGTYLQHAATYGATGEVSPPPQDWTTRTHAFTQEDAGEDARPNGIAKESQVALGDGWEAVYALVTTLHDSPGQVFATVGPHIFDFTIYSGVQGRGIGTEDGVGYRGSLRVGLIARGPRNVLATVHILCRPTERARAQWRLDTFAAIRTAHERAVREYEDALAAQSVSVGVKLPIRGAAESRQLALEEIRKACISIATAQHFDAFNAITSDVAGRPQISFAAAKEQGEYARFFEQVFEWENVQFILYPYYWGRKSVWEERVRMTTGSNPELIEFLKAGSARVVVPVRRGFEPALEHFQRTGAVFGGDGVLMGDGDFISIADEIRARTDRDYGNPTPIEEPWLVHLPTSLIWVRSDGELPDWEAEEG